MQEHFDPVVPPDKEVIDPGILNRHLAGTILPFRYRALKTDIV